MRIALVCPYDISYPGGVTNHVIGFASHLKKLGHRVTIIAPSSRKTINPDIVNAGKTIPLPIKGGTVARLGFSFWNFPRIKELFNKVDFDIIHLHEPGVPLLGLFALAYAPHRKSTIVVTFHSNAPYTFMTKAYKVLCESMRLRELSRKIDAMIAVSEKAQNLVAKYAPGQDCLIIPNAVDSNTFNPANRPIEKYADGMVNILYVGRLGNNEKRKGIKYLIKAFGILRSKNPNVRLLIVGPGKPDKETKKALSSFERANIVFTGKVDRAELPRYYATADIFCSPATHGESFGMVLIEAMASGKPVIASNIEGYREVIQSKGAPGQLVFTDAGVLVEPRNAKALAAGLEILSLNKKLRDRLGRNGRKIVLNQYSWDVVAEKVLKVYKKVKSAKHRLG